MHERSLDFYIGRCQVVHIPAPRKTRLQAGDLTGTIDAERVLIRTGTYPDPKQFAGDFAALAPEFIDFLAGRGVRLVGIDTPSVDLFDSKSLPAHQAVLRNDMAILEGIVLDDVPEGFYELIALPLKLVGFDASPVRAVLRRT
jgi:arylformamidase